MPRDNATTTQTSSSTTSTTSDTSVDLKAQQEETILDPPRPRSCCYSRLWMDLTGTCRCTPSFQPIDEIHKSDGSTETLAIDIPSSFSPPIGMETANNNKKIYACKKAAIIVWKLMVLLSEIAAFWGGFVSYPRAFWFGYLTNWALLLSMVYSSLSLVNTIFPVSVKQPSVSHKGGSETNDIHLSARIKMTWAFFTLAAVTQTLVTVLYWILVHPTGLFDSVSLVAITILHGGFCVLVLADGLLVNRIPIRMRHWFELCLPLFTVYLVWSVIQSPLGLDIDNPYMEDLGYNDDDKIYPFLDWASSPLSTLAIALVCVFLVTPLIQLALWALSWSGRLYVTHKDDNSDGDGHDTVEETSVSDGDDFDEEAQSIDQTSGNESDGFDEEAQLASIDQTGGNEGDDFDEESQYL